MKGKKSSSRDLRVALLWHADYFFGQRVLSGVYRQASFSPEATIRQFAGADGVNMMEFAKELHQWKPDGVITRISDPRVMAQWRELLPGIPIVSTVVVGEELVDSIVVMNAREAVSLAVEHFQSRGINNIACFFSGEPNSMATRQAAFQSLVPDGSSISALLTYELGIAGLALEKKREIEVWLHDLPKPVGVINLETSGASQLLQFCLGLGYQVPRDIQIIGAEDVDHALACHPHMTTIDAPCERIGETAFEILLHYIEETTPQPARYVEVSGSHLIARGSTGLSSVGMERVATAVNLMNQNPLKGMSAGHLVKKAKVSHTTFYKQFRETTGTTPAKQLRETRLKKACKMLIETELSVSDIAEQCGFSGGNYFARFFRNAMSITPTEYREQHQR
jgi:LacI family transcriptional regulator